MIKFVLTLVADRPWRLACDVLQQRDRHLVGEGQIEFAGDEPQERGRAAWQDRVFDAVEVGTTLFPVIGISRQSDRLVRFKLDEFEGASADPMAAHVARRHVAGVDRRVSGSEQREQGRLRALKMKDGVVVAVGGDFLDILVPALSRVGPQLIRGLAEQ